nr:MAG TPA: GNS1/SUR4 family protein [Caudoviricetes sp.]
MSKFYLLLHVFHHVSTMLPTLCTILPRNEKVVTY